MRALSTALTSLVLALATVLASTTTLGTAWAAEAAAPGVTLTGATSTTALTSVPLTLTLADAGAPVAGAPVSIDRRVGTEWRAVAQGVTDASGAFTASVAVGNPGTYVFRGTHAAPGVEPVHSPDHVVTVTHRPSELRLGGPASVVDEQSATFTVSWRAGDRPVAGTFTAQFKRPGGAWQTLRQVSTGADGRASFAFKIRWDGHLRLLGRYGPWWHSDVSNWHAIDNRPAGTRVFYPGQAPRPKGLPARPRATGAGANITSSTINNAVWSTMVGKSWRSGCPVGRGGLRLLRINYWGFDGYRYRGAMVVNADVVGTFTRGFRALYAKRIPIRAMWLPDRFGYSSRSRGADDYASMAHDNTSAFNCRGVTGNVGVRSPHSYGRSLDINPWQNPYLSRQGWVPNTWWVSRSHPTLAWRSYSHQVVEALAGAGFRWTYGANDAHHFDASVSSRSASAFSTQDSGRTGFTGEGFQERPLYDERGFPLD